MLTSRQRALARKSDAEIEALGPQVVETALQTLLSRLRASGDRDAGVLERPRYQQTLKDAFIPKTTAFLLKARDKFRKELEPEAPATPELTDEEAVRILREVIPIYLQHVETQGAAV